MNVLFIYQGSEVLNQVYMVAPVKNLARVTLSTNFPSKQIWRRMRKLRFTTSKRQEKVFMNFFSGIFGQQGAWCMNSSWLTSLLSSVNFRETSLLHLLYFPTYGDIKNSLPYLKHMLRAPYISMSLAAVNWECSLNQFFTSLFVSLFVHREPQKIFMAGNTEYRANLVKPAAG